MTSLSRVASAGLAWIPPTPHPNPAGGIAEYRVEAEHAGTAGDPLRGEHRPEGEAATRSGPVLEEDLVAARIEPDGVLADDAAGPHRGDQELVGLQRLGERRRRPAPPPS